MKDKEHGGDYQNPTSDDPNQKPAPLGEQLSASDAATLLWEEVKHHRNAFWQNISRWVLAMAVLNAAPYATPGISEGLGPTLTAGIFGLLGILLVISGNWFLLPSIYYWREAESKYRKVLGEYAPDPPYGRGCWGIFNAVINDEGLALFGVTFVAFGVTILNAWNLFRIASSG